VTGKTHAAAGALAGALAGRLAGDPTAGMVVGAIAALLPDVDHPGSWAGQRLRPVSVVLEALAGHRTVTHTVWFCLAVSVLVALAAAFVRPYMLALGLGWPPWWGAGLYALLGSLSHLALDALTRSGVEPLAPLVPPARLAWLEHPRGPIATGDPLVEVPTLIVLAWAALKVAGVL